MSIESPYYTIHPKIYDDQFWWKKDDIEFWKKVLYPHTSTVLELAAGTGRVAHPLIKEGFNYMGLEISKSYCDYANQSFINKSKCLFQGDIRCFDFNKKFDKIFIPFNSLSHLLNEKDFISMLSCIKNHMHSSSEFYIDIFYPHSSYLHKNKKPQKRIEFFNSINNQETIIKESLSYDEISEIITVCWDYESKKTIYDKFIFEMKIYYPDTINRILTDNGFEILALWGDYNQCDFSEESNLQIYKCKKLS